MRAEELNAMAPTVGGTQRDCCDSQFDTYHVESCPAMAAGRLSESLSDWWSDVTTKDMLAAVPKAIEYGSTDLEAMGVQLVALHPNVDAMSVDERSKVGLEMAIAFYLLGKATRIFGAYQRGGLPSDDTWHDLTVYSMMARRVRETGGWPGE